MFIYYRYGNTRVFGQIIVVNSYTFKAHVIKIIPKQDHNLFKSEIVTYRRDDFNNESKCSNKYKSVFIDLRDKFNLL